MAQPAQFATSIRGTTRVYSGKWRKTHSATRAGFGWPSTSTTTSTSTFRAGIALRSTYESGLTREAAALRHVRPDGAVVLVLGDAARVREELAALQRDAGVRHVLTQSWLAQIGDWEGVLDTAHEGQAVIRRLVREREEAKS